MLTEMMPLVSVVCSPQIREQDRRPYHREANQEKDQHKSFALQFFTRYRESNREEHHRESEGGYKAHWLHIHIAVILGDLTRLHKVGAHQEVPDARR